ncbi:translation initiation factor IF-2-like [Phyllostomus hastatus]|uniref:translation initiation factor IF-2-like n=1 Tax=Phyllostomus hastatus TaxID=9423 RepID=UPI001E68513F|nr:translation initiation factor IF-2-like [Phyllostomus hastatus]
MGDGAHGGGGRARDAGRGGGRGGGSRPAGGLALGGPHPRRGLRRRAGRGAGSGAESGSAGRLFVLSPLPTRAPPWRAPPQRPPPGGPAGGASAASAPPGCPARPLHRRSAGQGGLGNWGAGTWSQGQGHSAGTGRILGGESRAWSDRRPGASSGDTEVSAAGHSSLVQVIFRWLGPDLILPACTHPTETLRSSEHMALLKFHIRCPQLQNGDKNSATLKRRLGDDRRHVKVVTWPPPGDSGTALREVTCGSDAVFTAGHPREAPLTCPSLLSPD